MRPIRGTLGRMKWRSVAVGVAWVFCGANPAFAQQKGNVITINEITIVGRVQKPIASVDVSKIQARLTLGELRQPFADRIEQAARKDPF